MSGVEARARLMSVLDVLEHETQALTALDDRRLDDVLRSFASVRAEIVATLAQLGGDVNANGGSQEQR